MAVMTAEQAAEAAKGLTFEKVWAALMKTDEQFQETRQQIDKVSKQIAEHGKHIAEHDKQIAENWKQIAENDKQIAKVSKQIEEHGKHIADNEKQIAENWKQIAEVSRNIGGVNKSLGRWVEEMVYPNLWEKFRTLRYVFTKGGRRIKFTEDRHTIAESDIFLENGDYAMPVEIKMTLTEEDVDDHLDRMGKIRLYMDKHGDKRLLVGAVGGAIVPESVCRYAQKKGLYVLVQSGDSVVVAEIPKGFTVLKW